MKARKETMSNQYLKSLLEEQAERRQRRDRAVEAGGGDYGYQTVVYGDPQEALSLSHALQAEAKIRMPDYTVKNILSWVKISKERESQIRRHQEVANKLCALSDWLMEGNLVLRDIEIESGLLEPWSEGEMLSWKPLSMSRDIIDGHYATACRVQDKPAYN